MRRIKIIILIIIKKKDFSVCYLLHYVCYLINFLIDYLKIVQIITYFHFSMDQITVDNFSKDIILSHFYLLGIFTEYLLIARSLCNLLKNIYLKTY